MSHLTLGLILYLFSLICGLFLIYLDVKSGKIDTCISNIFNNNKKLESKINKDTFYSIYFKVTILLYLIPILNTIILILHLILGNIENSKKFSNHR